MPTDRAGPARASLFALGLLSILGQTVLLRELAVAFYGVELVYLLALGAWLAWGATGAAAARVLPLLARRADLLFLLTAAALPAEVAFLRGLRPLFAPVPGAYLPFSLQALGLLLSLAPSGVLLGLLFPATAVPFTRAGGTLASAYAWESAGGAAGGLIATLVLRLGFRNLGLALLCSLAALAASLAAGEGRTAARRAASVLAVLCIACLASASALDRRMTAWAHPQLLESVDCPYGRVTITAAGGQVSIFDNDALSFESESPDAEAFVHLTALQVREGARVLVLGGGVEGLVREVLRHAPERIDYVELSPAFYAAVWPHLPGGLQESLQAPQVRVVFEDPRAFLARKGLYDLILVGMPEPASGQANRFYTEEFFELCRNRLAPAGLAGLRLPSSENFRTPQSLGRTASVYEAARRVFSDVLIVPGTVDVILAGARTLVRDPDTLADRLRQRRIEARLVTPEYLRYLFADDRFAALPERLRTARGPVNTDGRPVCFRHSALIWLSRFFPVLARLEPNASPPWLWILGAAGVALLLARRFGPGGRRAMVVGAAALAGMVAEAVLLLHYQVKSGVLFQDIGALLTSFMAGLTLGAKAFERLSAARGHRGVAVAATLALVGLCGSIAALVWSPVEFGLAPTVALLTLDGALVAGLFAWAGASGGDPGCAAAPLYAADLLGGSAGSLLAGFLLIPFAGLSAAAWVAAAVALVPVVLMSPSAAEG